MKKQNQTKNLKTYFVENDSSKPTIIMLHGYGANGRDLAGLASYPAISKLDHNWVFIEAPLSPPELAAFGGFAWFNLTLSSFGPNMSAKTLEEFYGMTTDEFKQSLEAVESTIWDLDLKGDVFVGGFSQGAMMAANVFFKSPHQYKGLIAMSGAPLNFKAWAELSEPKKIFISHGEQDPVLPVKCGKDLLQKVLEKRGLAEEHWFSGGHEIPPSVLNKLAQFLVG
jgi:phospholipase/carboxylesterase